MNYLEIIAALIEVLPRSFPTIRSDPSKAEKLALRSNRGTARLLIVISSGFQIFCYLVILSKFPRADYRLPFSLIVVEILLLLLTIAFSLTPKSGIGWLMVYVFIISAPLRYLNFYSVLSFQPVSDLDTLAIVSLPFMPICNLTLALFFAVNDPVPISSPIARFAYPTRYNHLVALQSLALTHGLDIYGPMGSNHRFVVRGYYSGRETLFISCIIEKKKKPNYDRFLFYVALGAKQNLLPFKVDTTGPIDNTITQGLCRPLPDPLNTPILYPSQNPQTDEETNRRFAILETEIAKGSLWLRKHSIIESDGDNLYLIQFGRRGINIVDEELIALINWMQRILGVMEHQEFFNNNDT